MLWWYQYFKSNNSFIDALEIGDDFKIEKDIFSVFRDDSVFKTVSFYNESRTKDTYASVSDNAGTIIVSSQTDKEVRLNLLNPLRMFLNLFIGLFLFCLWCCT